LNANSHKGPQRDDPVARLAATQDSHHTGRRDISFYPIEFERFQVLRKYLSRCEIPGWKAPSAGGCRNARQSRLPQTHQPACLGARHARCAVGCLEAFIFVFFLPFAQTYSWATGPEKSKTAVALSVFGLSRRKYPRRVTNHNSQKRGQTR